MVVLVILTMMVAKKTEKESKPVTICKHSGSPSKDCPPEAKAAIVVDCVVGLQLVIDDFMQCDDNNWR